MLERFRAFWTKVISPVAHLLIKLGVSADVVTLVGTIGVCAGALVFYPGGHLLVGTIVITCFVFSDLIDGYMSRLTGTTSKFGAFLDSTLDRVGDGAVFGGLVLYFAGPGHSRLYTWLALVCLVMGAVTSYARSRAESLGYQAKVGLAERSDRLVTILVLTGFAGIFHQDILVYIPLWWLAFASTVTVGQRIWVVRKQALAEAAAAPAASGGPVAPAPQAPPAPGTGAPATPEAGQ